MRTYFLYPRVNYCVNEVSFCVHLLFKTDFSLVVFVFLLNPQNSSLGILILKLSRFALDKLSRSERGHREAVRLKSPKALKKKCVTVQLCEDGNERVCVKRRKPPVRNKR